MMTPLREEIKPENSALDSLYKELDIYIEELNGEEMTESDMLNEKTIVKQPSFNFQVATDLEDSLNNSSVSTNSLKSAIFSDQGLKRQRSWQSHSNITNTHNIHFSLSQEKLVNSVGCMSELSTRFISHIKALNESRDIFCSTEYPNSFTGEEAVDIIAIILPVDWTRKEYRSIARSFMQTVPPLFVPVTYSDKSLKNNTLYDSPKEAYTLTSNDTLHQGLVTSLLECYTPMCIKGISNGCYSPTCPNKGSQLLSKSNIVHKDLQRNMSFTSSVASSQDTFVSRCWSNSVSRETRQKTPIKEIKRQEAIYELIYTEEDYVRDLNLLDDLFAKPLLTAQCIEPEKREDFCKEIFGNYSTIAQFHRDMYRELRDHQLTSIEDGGFVDSLGHILLKYVDRFMKAYTDYAHNFIHAEYTAKQEMAHNILFQNFIREKEKQAETRKLPFRHFIILPITRLQRYPLLLDAILKRTLDETEKQKLISCISIVTKVAKEMDTLMIETKKTLKLRQINDKIHFKPGYQKVDLDLLKPGRQLIYEGKLKRRSHLAIESVELHVFLFDHMLVMTKPKKYMTSDAIESYTISKNPIPLDLLVVEDVAENFIFNTFRSSTRGSLPTTTTLPLSSEHDDLNQSSLMIKHLGRSGGEYILYTETPSTRYIWKGKIMEAKNELKIRNQPKNVFRPSVLSSTSPGAYGKVTCAAPFVGEHGQKMIVLGTQQGVWMGKEDNTSNGFKRVLTTTDVTQIGVLATQNILLVLADRVLTVYPIAQLDPYASPCDTTSNKKLNDKTASFRILSTSVSYFNTGTCNDRTLVIAMKRKVSASHFKAYEPTCGDLKDPKNSKLLVTKTSFMSKPSPWFKVYKEFYIGTDSTAVHFLKSKVLVECSKGFEVIDLEHLSDVNTNFPDLRHRDYQFLLNAEAPKPLGIFRCNEKNFLLCYDKFAFLMSTRGDYVKEKYKRIEWESNPVSVAFSYPYVVAFDPKFIEIRHVDTGKLIQIIAGDNTRYLPSSMNNTNATSTTIYCSAISQTKSDNQHVFKLDLTSS